MALPDGEERFACTACDIPEATVSAQLLAPLCNPQTFTVSSLCQMLPQVLPCAKGTGEGTVPRGAVGSSSVCGVGKGRGLAVL